jgi:hypothetical protein
MVKKYRVIFLSLTASKEEFKERMSRLGVSPATAETILNKAPVILKGCMTLGDARQYADAMQSAGGRVHIQEQGLFEEDQQIQKFPHIRPLQDFTMCPECGHKQTKSKACLKCGFKLPTHMDSVRGH